MLFSRFEAQIRGFLRDIFAVDETKRHKNASYFRYGPSVAALANQIGNLRGPRPLIHSNARKTP